MSELEDIEREKERMWRLVRCVREKVERKKIKSLNKKEFIF